MQYAANIKYQNIEEIISLSSSNYRYRGIINNKDIDNAKMQFRNF